ncbi:MAG: asparagine synthetase B [Bacteroidia bacterium]
MLKRFSLILLFTSSFFISKAAYILIPMDDVQRNHLKAYGLAYFSLSNEVDVDWLLNYRGGSFALKSASEFEKECIIRGVSYEILADAQYNKILSDIARPEVNMEVVKLEKPPKIAVYSPKTKQPWDDAVTLVLTHAEIPYDVIYDDDVLGNKLALYDWLHLHHEDFTGQFGKFWAAYKNQTWYQAEVQEAESIAAKWGYSKVSELKLAVAKKIRDYVFGGGFLFAMCSATDTYDIALAAEGVDICESMFDGDPMDPHAQQKLNYDPTFAFKDFVLKTSPYDYEYSSIDAEPQERQGVSEQNDFFTLFEFSAKWDIIPSMLCQNHTRVIKGFMGQTTAFENRYIKSDVLVMGQTRSLDEAKYIHGEIGKGMWTFYGGHDPEDYQHMVGEPPTDLNLHTNSPGYRLILNNVLFPAARKQKQKT